MAERQTAYSGHRSLLGAPFFLFLTGWTLSIPVLVLAMIGFGYFKGLYDANIIAGIYDVVAIQNRGTAAGIANSLGWLGGGLAPIIIALGSEKFGMSACISATGVIYLVIGLLTLLASRRLRGTRGPVETMTPLWPAADTSEIWVRIASLDGACPPIAIELIQPLLPRYLNMLCKTMHRQLRIVATIASMIAACCP